MSPGNRSLMRERKSGTSSATNLLMFMSRSVRIMRKTSELEEGVAKWVRGQACRPDPATAELPLATPCRTRKTTQHAARTGALPAAPHPHPQPHLSGLARLEAPAVRSTERMLRSPKS